MLPICNKIKLPFGFGLEKYLVICCLSTLVYEIPIRIFHGRTFKWLLCGSNWRIPKSWTFCTRLFISWVLHYALTDPADLVHVLSNIMANIFSFWKIGSVNQRQLSLWVLQLNNNTSYKYMDSSYSAHLKWFIFSEFLLQSTDLLKCFYFFLNPPVVRGLWYTNIYLFPTGS